ncbi:hypothetical protein L207DRAFT_563943 [Hyaloscypha variabilis F]|jgi:hypothetical protein|uniref:Heterokaryon incompatibility domain-containing protein n=1 Tax=Hyaloscypha variabilis (strain UAMH 11265 / GT02V1 / F) TaxID=1149755 RepID=A0A2J6RXG8_HYAVF|nr:hypothetical protein L207DRAFT_563943 [Hyaloscypha variabilis F]
MDGNISLIYLSSVPAPRAEFINCDVEPLSVNDPFGKVKKGTLVLHGLLKQATGLRWLDSESDVSDFVDVYDQDEALKIGSVWLDVGSECPEEDVKIAWLDCRPWCLQICVDKALLLFVGRENRTYERVGIVYVFKEDWFKDAMVETVAII